jgi:DNA replication protein DnaC
MKPVNIQSLSQAESKLTPDSMKEFLDHFGIKIKPAERVDLARLVRSLEKSNGSMSMFEGFYIGYEIPQIGKEFDLLRIDEMTVVNVELKRDSTEEEVQRQLARNAYYLSFIGRKLHAFSYISEREELYVLKEDKTLERTDFQRLVDLIQNQDMRRHESLDDLFDPTNYLTSPFNSTDKFLGGEYFLTHQQEEIKTKVVELVTKQKASRFVSITGGPGTGKTLLTYDITKHLLQHSYSVLILHCGILNSGHAALQRNNWKIASVKDHRHFDLANFDLLVLDEMQRVRTDQYETIVANAKRTGCPCIFSYDKLQTLTKSERTTAISERISSIDGVMHYELSKKIRTNKELAEFIRQLFNNKATTTTCRSNNIKISYFSTANHAKKYIDEIDSEQWNVLRFTPSRYQDEIHTKYAAISQQTSHEVIGQEFDRVVVVLDEHFAYDKNGDLEYKAATYYDMPRMLFQNITRCRKQLNVVIVNNEDMLRRCLRILM